MNLYIINHDYHYEIENLTRVFFPNEKINILKEYNSSDKNYIYTEIYDNEIKVFYCFEDSRNEKTITKDNNSDAELLMAQLLYSLLVDYTKIVPPWGVLTGIRPIKLFRNLADNDGENFAESYFRNDFLVSDKKINLTKTVEKHERKILDLSERMSYSLYISIPFCPTRCSYCSFVSQSVNQAKKLIPTYVELLCKEIEYTARIARDLNLKLETIYIGGGTPTTLDVPYLKMIFDCLHREFDFSGVREFTVEAGRPDTITVEKLMEIKKAGADRISINPQTMNNSILEVIGRKHSAEETLKAFEMAHQVGIYNINADLIAGLPTESLESFKSSLDKMVELNAENITVHTLAMKRSSRLTAEGMNIYRENANTVEAMVDYSIEKLSNSGYHPYYLYRQSKMLGNLENTGWAKGKTDSLYNVYVMDETHTILACGAGAVSKLKKYKEKYLERIFNFKYPYEYIDRFNEIILRKDRVKQFYEYEF